MGPPLSQTVKPTCQKLILSRFITCNCIIFGQKQALQSPNIHSIAALCQSSVARCYTYIDIYIYIHILSVLQASVPINRSWSCWWNSFVVRMRYEGKNGIVRYDRGKIQRTFFFFAKYIWKMVFVLPSMVRTFWPVITICARLSYTCLWQHWPSNRGMRVEAQRVQHSGTACGC